MKRDEREERREEKEERERERGRKRTGVSGDARRRQNGGVAGRTKGAVGGLSNASFTSTKYYYYSLPSTSSYTAILQQLDTDTTENSIHFQIQTRLTGITTNFGNDGQASEGCLLLFVSSFFCWSLEYIYPSMFSDY